MKLQRAVAHLSLLIGVVVGQEAGIQMPQQVEQLFSIATNTSSNATDPNPTPKPHEITTSIVTPQHYENSSPYSSLSEEMQEFTHSRINADLRPGYDIMHIMLELLQWNDQDVEQMWLRPAGHVDQPEYDLSTAAGLDVSIQDLLRKLRFATLEDLCGHYLYQKPPSQHTEVRQHVQKALQRLVSNGHVIDKDGSYYPSFKQAGEYKLDLSGEINLLRHPLVKALQAHPGLASVHMDEHFIKTHNPAWYEIGTHPRT